jgi:hypothetical protein
MVRCAYIERDSSQMWIPVPSQRTGESSGEWILNDLLMDRLLFMQQTTPPCGGAAVCVMSRVMSHHIRGEVRETVRRAHAEKQSENVLLNQLEQLLRHLIGLCQHGHPGLHQRLVLGEFGHLGGHIHVQKNPLGR